MYEGTVERRRGVRGVYEGTVERRRGVRGCVREQWRGEEG